MNQIADFNILWNLITFITSGVQNIPRGSKLKVPIGIFPDFPAPHPRLFHSRPLCSSFQCRFRGARGTWAPSQFDAFSFSCSFRQKLCQIISWHSLLDPPLPFPLPLIQSSKNRSFRLLIFN